MIMTIGGVRVEIYRCPFECRGGELISAGGRIIGHVMTGRTGFRRSHTGMASTGCPGDVRLSTAHGAIIGGQYRMDARMRAIRCTVIDYIERTRAARRSA